MAELPLEAKLKGMFPSSAQGMEGIFGTLENRLQH